MSYSESNLAQVNSTQKQVTEVQSFAADIGSHQMDQENRDNLEQVYQNIVAQQTTQSIPKQQTDASQQTVQPALLQKQQTQNIPANDSQNQVIAISPIDHSQKQKLLQGRISSSPEQQINVKVQQKPKISQVQSNEKDHIFQQSSTVPNQQVNHVQLAVHNSQHLYDSKPKIIISYIQKIQQNQEQPCCKQQQNHQNQVEQKQLEQPNDNVNLEASKPLIEVSRRAPQEDSPKNELKISIDSFRERAVVEKSHGERPSTCSCSII